MWDDTESQATAEEHHQLPPYENVPEGRRSPEEEWKTRLVWHMSRLLWFRPVEWWEGKNICYRSLGIFYMVCQVIKGHALLLERVWGEFCNILNCTLLCDISEEHYILEDNFCSLYATG